MFLHEKNMQAARPNQFMSEKNVLCYFTAPKKCFMFEKRMVPSPNFKAQRFECSRLHAF
jgi:hypothetical protein